MTTFTYDVNGTTFEDTEAFGQAWEKAIALAEREHGAITRTVVRGESIRHEFFTKGGCFLDDRFYNKDKVKVF